MRIHAQGEGLETHIGTVVGVKKKRYIKVSKFDTLDGKCRYIPLKWVKTVKGNIIELLETPSSIRRKWLKKSEVKKLCGKTSKKSTSKKSTSNSKKSKGNLGKKLNDNQKSAVN